MVTRNKFFPLSGEETQYHKQEKMKKMRHSAGDKMPSISCLHTKNTPEFCHADQLTTDDLLKNFKHFYSRQIKNEQRSNIFERITAKQ